MKTYEFIDQQSEVKVIFNLPEKLSEAQTSYIKIILLDDMNVTKLEDLNRRFISCQKVDEMSIRTHYRIMKEEDKNIINISGNLFNAFGMMSERKLFNSEVVQPLQSDSEFNRCLSLTKTIEFEGKATFSPHQFQPRLMTLVDELSTELQSLSKQDSGKWLLFMIARRGLSLSELQQFVPEAHQESSPGLIPGGS